MTNISQTIFKSALRNYLAGQITSSSAPKITTNERFSQEQSSSVDINTPNNDRVVKRWVDKSEKEHITCTIRQPEYKIGDVVVTPMTVKTSIKPKEISQQNMSEMIARYARTAALDPNNKSQIRAIEVALITLLNNTSVNTIAPFAQEIHKITGDKYEPTDLKPICATNCAAATRIKGPKRRQYIKRAMKTKSEILHHSTNYGIINQSKAIDEYMSDNPDHSYEKAYLRSMKDHGYITAKPDGIVTTKEGIRLVLEVKTLPHADDIETEEEYKDYIQDHPTGLLDKDMELRKGHAAYYQIQQGMAVYNIKETILYLWTPNFHMIRMIPFDQQFWDDTMVKIKISQQLKLIK